jgi:hypothetical protein
MSSSAGHECRGVGHLLHPTLLLQRDHRPDAIEVLVSLLLDRFFLQLLHPHQLDPPPLANESPRGQKCGAGAIPGTLVFDVLLRPEPRETGWSGLVNQTI